MELEVSVIIASFGDREELTEKGFRDGSQVMKMFYIFTGIMVIPNFTLVKIYRTAIKIKNNLVWDSNRKKLMDTQDKSILSPESIAKGNGTCCILRDKKRGERNFCSSKQKFTVSALKMQDLWDFLALGHFELEGGGSELRCFGSVMRLLRVHFLFDL